MAKTSIEWTEVTWNPTTGCDRISAGCDNCYALVLAKRLQAMGNPKYQNDGNEVTSGPGFAITEHESALNIPYRWQSPRTVFVNSMSDLFHARVSTDFIQRVFEVMEHTPRHTYQLLTKRPRRAKRLAEQLSWPENVWLGTSIESDDQAWRATELVSVPAAVKFISAEPLLGSLQNTPLAGIDWVIAGGESGANSRPVDPAWVRDLRDRCQAEGVSFFFKQWGGRTPKANGRLLDGQIHDEMPTRKTRLAI